MHGASRRGVALAVWLGMSVAAVSTQAPSDGSSAPGPVAATKAGRLRGLALDTPRVALFKGIHYGQSTAGSNRFLPPRAVDPWTGVKEATRFGDVCPQAGDTGRRNSEGT